MFRPVAGGVYEVCPLAAYGAGRVVVDQVVRLDCLPGDPREPVFPALGGLGGLVGVQQVFPAQGAPSVLPGQQADGVGIQWGFTFRRRCAQYPARAGSSGDALPLTRVCRTMAVQASLGRWAPVSLSPNTHRSFLDFSNFRN